MPIIAGTWATVADSTELTGDTPSANDLTLAQSLIEDLARRVYRATDVDTSDYYWLRKAVAYQASYVHRNPDLYAQAEISSTSQDGWSITWRDSIAPRSYHPAAVSALNNLRGGSNVTIRFNSAFQGRGPRRRAGWRTYGGRY